MQIKFKKDQKWKIGGNIIAFKENDTKEISDISIAKAIIENGYGIEIKAITDYETKVIKPSENKSIEAETVVVEETAEIDIEEGINDNSLFRRRGRPKKKE